MLPYASLTFLSIATTATAACSRSTLQSATTALLAAQTAGNLSALPLSPNTSYIENDAALALSSSILTKSVPIDLSRSLHDTTLCATFTEIISATGSHPYVIMTRMLFTADGAAISRIENIVADKGDWLFNAQASLSKAKDEVWVDIPEGKRDARDVIQAAGDKYLDSWSDGKVSVPYGSPCARLEGGSYTTNCKMPEFPKEFKDAGGAKNRRYVVDEEVGAVSIFNDFPFLDPKKPNGTSSTNFVRVEGGKIRYIHEVTICTQNNCGR
ncbi:hypothetical protein DPSP01_002747 [Paraphaeosphaeria sporulosa]|uniref:DUF8021 domain-containing protein n=1 Tax=Paraphaeosphaeria sporulosa TaxID=1460663 RepID=A0A177CHD0_9PLEO|nr:uncharacterized protein CC84DRAFT_1259557 [Paraphaeosphaeria sporulosa]OAG06352.1 hypothetical protein CC84DRAFT_1259557 [Paraphaeosphaeria sporulosa]